MKNVVIEKTVKGLEISVVGVKTGRKVDPNSVRQVRLAELAAKRANGELRRGRPVDTMSERQFRLKKQSINKALGIGGQGRPINPNSARQIRLNELAAKAKLNGGAVKRGRPAKVKVEDGVTVK
jgi:hypothetical protein